MKSQDCGLCKKDDGEGSTLYETDNFYVAPTLGPLVEGHLLLISKEHILGIGHLEGSLVHELEKLREETRKVLTREYGTPIFFEHGPATWSRRGGCCVEHVHLHAIPIQFDLYGDLRKHFECIDLNGLEELRELVKREEDYIYYEDQEGKRYAFPIRGPIPPQYMRKLIAFKLGKQEEWDWRTNSNVRNFNRTLVNLARKFILP